MASTEQQLLAEIAQLRRELEAQRARADRAEDTIRSMHERDDRTAQRVTEDELWRTTSLLHALLATSPDPVFAKDLEGRMLLASPASLRAIGKPAEQVLGHTAAEWLDDPAQAESIMANDRSILATGQIRVVEETMTTPAGPRVFLGTKMPLRDQRGRVVGLIGTSRDITERKRIEDALRQSEERLRMALDAGRMGTWTLDLGTGDATWDAGMRRIFGVGPELRVRFPDILQQVVHPDDRAYVEGTVERALAPDGDGRYLAEYRILRRDGAIRRVLVTGQVAFAGDGPGRVPARMVGTIADVTEHREIERALRESEARFQQLVESLPQLVWAAQPGGYCDYLSPQWLAYTGQNESEHHGLGWGDALHPDDRERTLACWNAAMEGRGVYDLEYRLRGADGVYRWFHARAAALRDMDGRIVRWFGTSTDVHDRKLAEEGLRAAEEQFRALADNIAQLAWMTDSTGQIVWYNERWLEYTGLGLADMQGPASLVVPSEHADRVTEKYFRCIEAGEVWEDTFPLRGRDGSYRWFLSRAVPIRDREGRVLRWFGTNTDVTAQREVEEALKEADRRKDDFLAMLAHELRNPLAPVRTAVEVINLGGADAAKARQMRDMIERQVTHMARLLDDLLDVSRIARGKVQLRMERCDLVSIVRNVTEDYRPIFTAGGLTLGATLPAGPLWVQGDVTRLAQVIGNLLGNASKFSPPGGHVGVSLEADASGAVIAVRDTGLGIEPAMLARVFEPFVQAEGDPDRSKGGLGLGLALVRGLVELHGGSVEARSDGIGHGATFLLRLPLAPAEAADPAAGPVPASGEIQQGRLRILIIEDNRDTADSLQELLTLLGHEAEAAYAGPAALELAPRFRPDVVLCDIGLPGLDGFEVARALRQHPATQGAYLVAQTGYGQDEDRRRTRVAGFDYHLRKPVELDELQRLLAAVARR